MLRDKNKDKKYFESFLLYETERINKFEKMLERLETSDKIEQCKCFIANFYKNKMIAEYSVGYDKKEIRNTFDLYMKNITVSVYDSYADMIDILALSILLDYDGKELSDIMVKSRFDDVLMKILIKYIRSGKIEMGNEKLAFPEQYSIYIEILNCDDVQSASEKLRNFVNDNWYELNKDMPWYNSHNKDSDTYAGYWCWIGAAIAKMKSIPLSDLSECNYIPVDLIM